MHIALARSFYHLWNGHRILRLSNPKDMTFSHYETNKVVNIPTISGRQRPPCQVPQSTLESTVIPRRRRVHPNGNIRINPILKRVPHIRHVKVLRDVRRVPGSDDGVIDVERAVEEGGMQGVGVDLVRFGVEPS